MAAFASAEMGEGIVDFLGAWFAVYLRRAITRRMETVIARRVLAFAMSVGCPSRPKADRNLLSLSTRYHYSCAIRPTALVYCLAPIFIHLELLLRNAVSAVESSSVLSGGFAFNSPVSASHSLLQSSISFQNSGSNTP